MPIHKSDLSGWVVLIIFGARKKSKIVLFGLIQLKSEPCSDESIHIKIVGLNGSFTVYSGVPLNPFKTLLPNIPTV